MYIYVFASLHLLHLPMYTRNDLTVNVAGYKYLPNLLLEHLVAGSVNTYVAGFYGSCGRLHGHNCYWRALAAIGASVLRTETTGVFVALENKILYRASNKKKLFELNSATLTKNDCRHSSSETQFDSCNATPPVTSAIV